MTYLEALLLGSDTIEAIEEVRLAAQAVYGFTGGDNPKLGRAIWKTGAVLGAIEKWKLENPDYEEDSDAVSA